MIRIPLRYKSKHKYESRPLKECNFNCKAKFSFVWWSHYSNNKINILKKPAKNQNLEPAEPTTCITSSERGKKLWSLRVLPTASVLSSWTSVGTLLPTCDRQVWSDLELVVAPPLQWWYDHWGYCFLFSQVFKDALKMMCDKTELITLHGRESRYPKCHNVIPACCCPRGGSCVSHLTGVLPVPT